MRLPFIVSVFLIVFLIDRLHASVSLADSAWPIQAANPQRNYKFNRPISCASVSNGKTTVLDLLHTFPNADAPVFSATILRSMALDEKGWAYITVNVNESYHIHRFNTTDGSFNDTFYFDSSYDNALLTLLAGGLLYYSGKNTTNVVNTTNFQSITTFADPASFGSISSMVPYKGEWMVKSIIRNNLNNVNVLMYFKDSVLDIDPTLPNITADFTGTLTQSVLIYKSTTDTTEFPIVIGFGNALGSPTVIASPSYTTSLANTVARSAFIVGDEIVVSAYDSVNGASFYKLDAATGAITLNQTYPTWNGLAPTQFTLSSSLMYHNGKALAAIATTSQNTSTQFVDLVTGQTMVVTPTFLASDRHFSFASDDQTVLALGVSTSNYFEIMGFEWDTWKVNVRGRFSPPYSNDSYYGSVVIGDNCRVHISIDHVYYTLAPLPIQNVIPILECVDRDTRVGYFTYNNTGSKGFSIPQVDDRNNLSPMNIAPIEVFAAGFGPNFPFSARVPLNASDSFTWVLEDHVLSFTISSDLYCPETISFGIVLTADGTFPQGFDLVVRDAFINVTGISGSRVTLVAKKRSIEQDQNSLETDLSVAPDPTNSEPSPAEVVQQFTTQEQQNEFTQQVQTQSGAPDNIQTSLAGKTPSNAVQGQVTPGPVAAQPTSTPQASAPSFNPTAAPVSNPTSSASVLHPLCAVVLVVGLILSYPFK